MKNKQYNTEIHTLLTTVFPKVTHSCQKIYTQFVGIYIHVSDLLEKHATHGARRTFICVALELGIPTTVIRKITGHANEAAMRPYIAITDKTIIEAMSKFSSRKTL